MQINLPHFHYWMQAVRQSPDPMRTMDAFWQGQMNSKMWLISELRRVRPKIKNWPSVEIHGGWVGTLSSMLFQSDLYIKNITSIDIDPECEKIANMMNQIEHQDGRFKAITADMCGYDSTGDIVINTSCEHISQEQYDQWLDALPQDCWIILQSNDYDIPEHIRIASTLEEFKQQSHLAEIKYAGELKTQLYTRWMLIGKKNA